MHASLLRFVAPRTPARVLPSGLAKSLSSEPLGKRIYKVYFSPKARFGKPRGSQFPRELTSGFRSLYQNLPAARQAWMTGCLDPEAPEEEDRKFRLIVLLEADDVNDQLYNQISDAQARIIRNYLAPGKPLVDCFLGTEGDSNELHDKVRNTGFRFYARDDVS
uniref:Uncharacterized protein n=1 Tax=Lotharella globosa TaxID=91324 RepID=A0A6U3EB23_9EUKA|mmetsp:Transcript_6358/g.11932  ORF Transcript_6358/g.11932 Transcript_6358/m.11932 type:complete len:163 (+) Transcript_6358:58-546(+)|eukprot:CAMPEP_0167771464 /NCGR_PEP_ID=MMETSP0111_2-20121227/293_1 /TAXON_ID=91324 /ORGANISM="Lotharella globosa, Strain CCCM811" /LENGTH=162 /DNA_ID=CAMNT_0007660821 /DNA_START=24 /DNA_END=512 /DNA_ORIENTATION=-